MSGHALCAPVIEVIKVGASVELDATDSLKDSIQGFKELLIPSSSGHRKEEP